ncbi:MAG: hypothetical protein NVS3B20_00940 [Polyangiales bacterium]
MTSESEVPSEVGGALSHEDAIGLLDIFHDGELSENEAQRVKAHLATCARCQAVESLLGGSIRSAVKSGIASNGLDLLPGVQRRIRLRSRGRFYGDTITPSARRRVSSWPLVVGSLALLAALLVAYLMIGQVATAPKVPPDIPKPTTQTS